MSDLALVLSLSFVAGCDTPREDGSSSGSGGMTTGGGEKPTCELVSRTELADANVVAPNGQTGAQILAAVPATLHTTLNWDFSSTVSGVRVEVPGSIGLSTKLDLVFSFASEPQFFFEDMTVVYPAGDVDMDVDVICEDYVTTTLDVGLASEDGTLSLNLTGLTVRLGPDRPETDYVAKPSVYEGATMSTPQVDFVEPEALPASLDKTISMVFDDMAVEGAIIVYAQGAAATYEHLVARW